MSVMKLSESEQCEDERAVFNLLQQNGVQKPQKYSDSTRTIIIIERFLSSSNTKKPEQPEI